MMKTSEKFLPKVMELINKIKDTWKVFIIGCVISCLMVLILLNENSRNSNLSNDVRITIVPIFGESSAPTSKSVMVISPTRTPSLVDMVPAPAPSNMVMAPAPMPSLVVMAPAPTPSNMVMAPSPTPSMMVSPAPIASMAAEEQSVTLSSLKKQNVTLNNDIAKPVDFVTNVNSVEITRKKVVVKKCNIFDGKWIYKADAKPSYCTLKCPFIEEKMSCQRNGRPDFEYEKWVWKPMDCDIPMINGTDMVERFRNKRIILVGDSLNRNMWESLSCILYSSIPIPSSITQVHHEDRHIKTYLIAKGDYNFTVEFFWSPYLVELNQHHESGQKVLVLDKLSPNSENWVGADIMIFNSGFHWIQVGIKKKWDMFEYKGKLTKDMPLHQAYTRAMGTWANWVTKNVDPNKTTVFFRSISAQHQSPHYNQWCYSRTQPMKMKEVYKPQYPKTFIRVIENVIKGMTKPQVNYLNITNLSGYRIDAHPSVYRSHDWKNLTQVHKHNLAAFADCGHWCLPGIPDTWNRLLYATLFFDNSRDVSFLVI